MRQKIKRLLLFLMISCMALSLCGCGASDETEEQESSDTEGNSTEIKEDSKILIAYFSRADENYAVGYIEKGNTAIIAEMIADETGGDLFHIERATSYSADYDECTDEAKQEQNENARPALAEDKDISEYDVIFLGYPIWLAYHNLIQCTQA